MEVANQFAAPVVCTQYIDDGLRAFSAVEVGMFVFTIFGKSERSRRAGCGRGGEMRCALPQTPGWNWAERGGGINDCAVDIE